MRRRIISLLLICLLVCSMVLTSCSDQQKSGFKELAIMDSGNYFDGNMSGMVAAETEDVWQEGFNTEGFNTEEYNAIKENEYVSVKNSPLSTFSIDVDTASYSNVRRMLLDGNYFDGGAVRIEEMINYFSYDYPTPENGEIFSINTEVADCPWNEDTKLMLVSLQTEKPNLGSLPNSNLVFLIDVSGSMDMPDKLPLVQTAFSLLTENLDENDKVSIVTYAGFDTVVLDGCSGNDKKTITDAIEGLFASGSTHGSKGIETAYEIAQKHFIKGGNNRIILATDGDLNVGVTSESALKKLVEEKREAGVYLSVLGFGTGNIKDNKMETLADNGNGNYSYIDSVLEAKKVLVEEMGGTLFTVAKDVKIQVEFNPENVKGYRLIGYENRLLSAQDFEDDTKDAGEIGAGHSVTALYELVFSDSKMDIPETDLKYQKDGESVGNPKELLMVSIRYKEPDSEKSNLITKAVFKENISEQMSDDLSFAAGVAQFGMLLRDSKYAGTSDYDSVYNRLSELESVKDDEYKKEFLYLITRAKTIERK